MPTKIDLKLTTTSRELYILLSIVAKQRRITRKVMQRTRSEQPQNKHVQLKYTATLSVSDLQMGLGNESVKYSMNQLGCAVRSYYSVSRAHDQIKRREVVLVTYTHTQVIQR